MHKLPALAQLLTDARIAALVAAPAPALLVAANGELRFANHIGLALLGAATLGEAIALGAEKFASIAAATQRLMATLSPGGPPLTERVELAGASRPIDFAGSRIALADGSDAILFLGISAKGETAPELASAAASIFNGERDPFALFDSEGGRIYANPAAAALMGSALRLAEIAPAASSALAMVHSEGAADLSFGVLQILLRRIVTGAQPTVLAFFVAPVRPAMAESEKLAEVSSPEPMEKTEEQEEPVFVAAVDGAEAADEVTAPAQDVPAQAATPSVPRQPTRFVWHTDAEDHFTSISPELAAVVGEQAAAIIGLDWQSASARIGILQGEAVTAAIARRDTWSGASVLWPTAEDGLVRPVDLAALPIFDRERHFLGYRGFGVFREAVARPARNEPIETTGTAPVPETESRPEQKAEPPSPPEPAVLAEGPENVIPLRPVPANSDQPRAALSPGERNAFREIARILGTKLKRPEVKSDESDTITVAAERPPVAVTAAPIVIVPKPDISVIAPRPTANGERTLLDRLPLGIAVHRAERLLYANRTLLDWIGFTSTEELSAAGGISRLFAAVPLLDPEEAGETGHPLAISGHGGEPIPVEARLLSVPWEGESALVYVLRRAGAGLDERIEAGELALREADATARELHAILDTATDGIALVSREGHILGMNHSAEALFGFESSEVEGRSFATLFAPESHRSATDYLEGLASNGVASVLNDGREVIGREREGGLIPLFMTIGRVGEDGRKFCAVFRDITQWKRAEEELIQAKRQAERASSAKSEFLAKISHEIRTPLNAIIGFSEVMMEERFGPIGNDRYREYLKDIHASGEHLVSLINDLLDLSKIEAGKLDLSFASISLNDIASQCMAIMQPQANRDRIIIRTALSPNLPPVVADVRSIRQIVLNLLSNSIKFTPPGGQVIVSTSLAESGEVHLRVRDTGIGMSEPEIKTALEPFRQLNTTGRTGTGGTGLGLPLTKAMVEANRATFTIKSSVNAGTLVEITFPSTRVLAE